MIRGLTRCEGSGHGVPPGLPWEWSKHSRGRRLSYHVLFKSPRESRSQVWIDRAPSPDNYPLPRQEDIVNRIKGKEHFTIVDGSPFFHQLPIPHRHRDGMAVISPRGLEVSNVALMGFKNSSAFGQYRVHIQSHTAPVVMLTGYVGTQGIVNHTNLNLRRQQYEHEATARGNQQYLCESILSRGDYRRLAFLLRGLKRDAPFDIKTPIIFIDGKIRLIHARHYLVNQAISLGMPNHQ
ncbi:uncharacterized protein GGS25DRAFT_265905 [Hypoxylon fragiforme]|uniref:uncharacterized protein n=1 Tax=Hypoxylon fragiforme TaxID=63214 RepID=UPI0020C72C3B|nr:uncharacterized protein GGS25DRAFT_265905 [Hypoxylon fragiforme]KAI2608231.1 hypothetical protein GGS25DRAFT_265905 [Hypoxylon fragiforme]